MASNLLKTFEKIERGRQKCITKANEKNYQLPNDASLEQVAQCIASQVHLDEYLKDYKALVSGDASILENNILRLPSDITTLSKYVFTGKAYDNIVWPDHLEEIDSHAFYDTDIKHIDIPDTVKKIGSYAFFNSSTRTVSIPSSVSSIGDDAFDRCMNMVIEYDGRCKQIPGYCFSNSSTSGRGVGPHVNLTDESIALIESIGHNGFRGATFNKTPFNRHTKSFGEYALYYCTFDEPVELDNFTCGRYAFEYCDFNKPVSIGLTSCNTSAFEYAKFNSTFEFKDVLPTYVSLATYAFNSAQFSQEHLILPKCIKNFPSRCFQSIQRITTETQTSKTLTIESLYDGKGLGIGEGAFTPAYYTDIIYHARTFNCNVNNAFVSNNGKNVVFLNMTTVPTITTSGFNKTNLSKNGGYIYVPDDMVAAAKAKANWSTFSAYIKPLSQWSRYNEYKDKLLPREEA